MPCIPCYFESNLKVKSIDTSCHSLSASECGSGQFYETDANGTGFACSSQGSGVCGTSLQGRCEASKILCSQGHDARAPDEQSRIRDTTPTLCRSLCFKTNVAVTGLSCSDLSSSHCASAQFYETDHAGHRRPCVPQKGKCEMDSINFCPPSQPVCAETWLGEEIPIPETAAVVPTSTKSMAVSGASSGASTSMQPQAAPSLQHSASAASQNGSSSVGKGQTPPFLNHCSERTVFASEMQIPKTWIRTCHNDPGSVSPFVRRRTFAV